MKEKTDNMECFAKITSCKKKVYHKYYDNKFGIEKTNLFLQGVLCVILLLLCNVVSAQFSTCYKTAGNVFSSV